MNSSTSMHPRETSLGGTLKWDSECGEGPAVRTSWRRRGMGRTCGEEGAAVGSEAAEQRQGSCRAAADCSRCSREEAAAGSAPRQRGGWTGERGPPSGPSWHCGLSGSLTCLASGSSLACLRETRVWAIFTHHLPARHPEKGSALVRTSE